MPKILIFPFYSLAEYGLANYRLTNDGRIKTIDGNLIIGRRIEQCKHLTHVYKLNGYNNIKHKIIIKHLNVLTIDNTEDFYTNSELMSDSKYKIFRLTMNAKMYSYRDFFSSYKIPCF